MLRKLVVMSLITVACSVVAQGPPPQVRLQQAVPMGGTVLGHIYCGDTHGPARLARVSLRQVPQENSGSLQRGGRLGGGGNGAMTDMEGSFQMTGVGPGSYYVDVQMPGYIPPLRSVAPADLNDASAAAQARVRSKVQVVTLNGNDTARADVTVERGAALSGVVRFDDGSPAANISVNASLSTDALGIQAFQGVGGFAGSGRTDDRGVFRIAGIPPGEYLVSANVLLPAAAVGRDPVPLPGGNLTVYSPSTLRRAGAAKFSAGIGDERNGVEITVPLRGLHSVSGRLSGTQSGAQGRVVLRDKEDGSMVRIGSIAQDGTFRIDAVMDGSYTVEAPTGRAGTGNSSSQAVSVQGSDVTDVVLAQ